MKIKKTKEHKKIKSESKIENQKRHKIFLEKKKEMRNLFKQAHDSYIDNLKQNKKKNSDDFKQIKIDFKTSINVINEDYANKKISEQEKISLINNAKQKHLNDLDSYNSMKKNRKLAVVSEYKRTQLKIEKTYMDDVIKHLFFYRLKRWAFGLNKEFSRVTWWNKKHVFMDFVIIIIIVGALALIFMGIDMAYLKA